MRALLKSLLPEPVRRPLRRGETYARRLTRWLMAIRQVEGVSARDRAVLRRSLLASPVISAREIDSWQDPQLIEDAMIKVHGVGTFRVRAGTDDFYHLLPLREPALVRVLRERLKPGSIFVDAGANIGFYSILAASLVAREGRVIAIEMMPDTAGILRDHLALNQLDQVEVVERALSDRSGGRIVAHVVPGKFGQASIAHAEARGIAVEVSCATLDDILADVPHVTLMKMDLEGAEAMALRGASTALERIDAIIFEQLGGDEDPAQLLKSAGFSITAIDGNNRLAART